MTIELYAMTAAVCVSAGLVYSFAGYKAKVSKYFRGDPAVKFSISKMAKTAGLGIFLGLAAFATEDILNGDALIEITNPGVFFKQVGATMAIIYVVDKLMIAGSDGGSRKSAINTNNGNSDNIPVGLSELDADNGPPGST